MTSDTLHHTVPAFNCTETVRRLWDYLDRELSDDEVAAVDAHLADCSQCPPHFTFEREFLAALKAARSQDAAGTVLRARVEAALGRDGLQRPGNSHE